MGVSIVAAKGGGQGKSGINVKEVIANGPAAVDGRVSPGDQIIEVDGESLVGIEQEDAVKILIKCGSIVNLTIAKGAAEGHGVVKILNDVFIGYSALKV
ncbi:afadin-like [Xenia sp. Carnegie-2017]|uniref:afadin-like n=1 Tax=Xenia sp. Carnegie-2017 TaxID=2897299 RepID=UPI001F04B67D|nr:afadin-like [Xenia sp. Carnegie-2017]